MSDPCEVYGWGFGPWGEDAWAAPTEYEPGGPIPFLAPFDVFCVGSCGPLTVLDTYTEVEEFYTIGQIVSTAPAGDDLRFTSGGPVSDTTAWLRIEKSAPQSWTLEYSVRFDALPDNFYNLAESHAYIGLCATTAASAGIFFSKQGLLYTGSVIHALSGELSPNQPTQFLPGSIGDVVEGDYYVVRIAMDGDGATTYIYITPVSELPVTGHQLRYVMPAVLPDSAVDTPVAGVVLSVKGTATGPVTMDMNSICLGQGLLIPNLPPIADAGNDFSAMRCSIVRLNGELSRDPEEAAVAYSWRLVDAPEASREAVVCDDGVTTIPTPYTNKLYSVQLANANALDPIVAGDVVRIGGLAYDVATTGTDGGGFFVTVTDFTIPSPQSNADFKVLRQRGLQGADTVRPTFYMDVTGAYRFALRVFDGQLFSPDVDVVVNSLDSEVARGVVPDVSFLWGHIGSFWELVEGKEPIEVLWSSVAHIAASELLSLWQHDSAKGIQGISRLFLRRWLHYDMFVEEPLPHLTEVGAVSAGLISNLVPAAGVAAAGYAVVLQVGDRSYTVYLTGSGLITAAQMADQIQRGVGSAATVTTFTEGSGYRVRVQAQAPVEALSGTMALFNVGSKSSALEGSGGVPVGLSGYRLGASLAGTGVTAGDYLILGKNAHRIVSVTSDPADSSPGQRVILHTPPELWAPSEWRVSRPVKSKYLDFYSMLASGGDIAVFDASDALGDVYEVRATVWGATPDGELLVNGLDLLPHQGLKFRAIHRRTYVRVDPLVQEIPHLQAHIASDDDTEVLRQNIDFFIDDFRGQHCIRFVTGSDPGLDVWEYDDPPRMLWAESTYLDNRPTIEAQYGRPMEFSLDDLASLPSDTDYLSVVRGLWFSSLNGPAMHNLRVGAQILLGLPFAEEAGTIEEVDTEFSVNQGRVLVKDASAPNLVRAYTYPKKLKVRTNPTTGKVYAVGDYVEQFAPLVDGVEVEDYVSKPNWWLPYQQQGVLFEVEKFFRFLVRVDSEAFNLATLLFVKTFINRVKPSYTFPLFVVRRSLADATFDITDSTAMNVTVRLYDGLCNSRGLGYMIDDPNPAGGGLMASVDSGSPIQPAPAYPVHGATYWGVDQEVICPQDYVVGRYTFVLAAPALPTLDSIYLMDSPLFTAVLFDQGVPRLIEFRPEGVQLGADLTAAGNFTLTDMQVRYEASYSQPTSMSLQFVVRVNNVDAAVVPVVLPSANSWNGFLALPAPVNVAPGDLVQVFVRTAGPSPILVEWVTVSAALGVTYYWAFDTITPAGTYYVTRTM